MKIEESKAASTLKRYEQLKSGRSSAWDAYFQELKDFARPNASDFTRVTREGARRNEKIFDSTAQWALEQFAGGVQADTTPETERWFMYGILGYNFTQDLEVLAWLEQCTDIVLGWYALPESNHSQSLHEAHFDLGLFGTEIVLQEWNPLLQCPVFRAFPLASCYVLENEQGMIDTVFRNVDLTTRQAFQRFTEDQLPKEIKNCKDTERKWQFVHCVYPRPEEQRTPWGNAKGMPFASVWLCVDLKVIVAEGGYLDMPYHVDRWQKIAGENYGRSCGMVALSDIKMINEMSKVDIKSRQLAMAPPLQVPNDGFINDLDMTPYAVNFREPGTEKAEPLITGARPDVADSTLKMRQDAICRAFYTDQMELKWKNERQSAYEIAERRNDQLRRKAPMYGRVMKEMLGPMVKRSFSFGIRYGLFPRAPRQIRSHKMQVVYISPAALAQRGGKINAMKEYINQDLLPLAQVDPNVLDVIDTDAVAQEAALLRNVTRKIFRTPQQVSERRAAKQKQQQMSEALQGAQMAAGALRDVAVAGKNTPQLLGLPSQG